MSMPELSAALSHSGMERSGDRSGMDSPGDGSAMESSGDGSGMESSQQTRGAGEEMPMIPRQTFTPAKYAIGPFISLHSRYF